MERSALPPQAFALILPWALAAAIAGSPSTCAMPPPSWRVLRAGSGGTSVCGSSCALIRRRGGAKRRKHPNVHWNATRGSYETTSNGPWTS